MSLGGRHVEVCGFTRVLCGILGMLQARRAGRACASSCLGFHVQVGGRPAEPLYTGVGSHA